MQPEQVLDGSIGGHGLLNVFDATIGSEPFDLFEGELAGAPCCIGVYTKPFVGCGGTDGGEVDAIGGASEFEFEDWKGSGLKGFEGHLFWSINSNCNGRERFAVFEGEPEEFVEWLLGDTSGAVEQSDLDGAQRGLAWGSDGSEGT